MEAAGDLARNVAVVGEGRDEGEERERGEGDDDQQGHRLLALVLVAAVRHWVAGTLVRGIAGFGEERSSEGE